MKKINVEHYDRIEIGKVYVVETLGFAEQDGKQIFGPLSQERGTILGCHNKEREVVKDNKGTGKFETVATIVVYVKENPEPDYHYTVIGCGMFRIYEE